MAAKDCVACVRSFAALRMTKKIEVCPAAGLNSFTA